MGNDDLWTQTDVGEKYNLEGMRMNHTPGNRRIFHRYSCFVSVEESRWDELDIAPVTNIGRSDIYFAISKSRPDIKDTLDSAMRRIRDDNPFYTDELYQRYFSAQTSAFLSSEEKEWLAQHGDIRIGYLNNDTGVSVLNQTTGKLTGVITDYIELAKNCLQGETLTFVLPFKLDRCGSPVHEKLAATADIAGLRLLLVEDNDLNAEIAQFMLTDSGAEVVTVQNGLAAVQEIEKVKRTICEQIALCSQYNRIKED